MITEKQTTELGQDLAEISGAGTEPADAPEELKAHDVKSVKIAKKQPVRTSKKELAMLAKAAAEFARRQLAPTREENDTYPFGPFFQAALDKAFDVDFFHVILPDTLNGMNQGISALSVTLENICREDSSLGGILFTTCAAQELMMQAGALDALAAIAGKGKVNDFLIGMPVFNNPSEVKHLGEARKTGNQYSLSGTLEYMVLGNLAGQALVPAGLNGSTRFSYFLVDLSDPGISKSEPILSLGLHACPAVDMEFTNVPATLIGEEGKGGMYHEKMADRMNVAAAAMALGLMKGSFKEAFDYAKKRVQGGHEIINWSEVKMLLSNMAIKISNAEMIVEKACKAVDSHTAHWEDRSRAAALHVQDMACELTTDGIQLLGGVGYMKDFGQEKRFRDAKHIQALLGIVPVKKIRFIESMI